MLELYFPYLRGKQYELLAIRALSECGKLSKMVMPILEPVAPSITLCKTLETLQVNGNRIAFVGNPEAGDFLHNFRKEKQEKTEIYSRIKNCINNEQIVIKAFINKENSYSSLKKRSDITQSLVINRNRDDLDRYLDICENGDPKYSVIPDDRAFKRTVNGEKIVLSDGFNKKSRNADYADTPDEFFSDWHLFYQEEGFAGFSDYSIVGEGYNDSGFIPYAVAIHIVYLSGDKTLRVKHFVSENTKKGGNVAGKFGEALDKMKKWIDETNPYSTAGLELFMSCHKKHRFPGLGSIKQMSIMHHIELMGHFLESENI